MNRRRRFSFQVLTLFIKQSPDDVNKTDEKKLLGTVKASTNIFLKKVALRTVPEIYEIGKVKVNDPDTYILKDYQEQEL